MIHVLHLYNFSDYICLIIRHKNLFLQENRLQNQPQNQDSHSLTENCHHSIRLDKLSSFYTLSQSLHQLCVLLSYVSFHSFVSALFITINIVIVFKSLIPFVTAHFIRLFLFWLNHYNVLKKIFHQLLLYRFTKQFEIIGFQHKDRQKL